MKFLLFTYIRQSESLGQSLLRFLEESPSLRSATDIRILYQGQTGQGTEVLLAYTEGPENAGDQTSDGSHLAVPQQPQTRRSMRQRPEPPPKSLPPIFINPLPPGEA